MTAVFHNNADIVTSTLFQSSAAEKQQYAHFATLAQQFLAQPENNTQDLAQAPAIGFHPDGQWLALDESPGLDAACVHLIINSPSIALLETVLADVHSTYSFSHFIIHPNSDWVNGDVGIVLPFDRHVSTIGFSSTEIKAFLSDLAQRFCVEAALLIDTPRLAQPGLLVMDMDSTVIAVECIDEIAKLAGVGDAVSAVTERAMRGELDFSDSLRSRVACLKGLDESALKAVCDALPPMPGLNRLVYTLQNHGWKIAIASGGFTYFAEHLRQRFRLDAAVANVLAIEQAKLTGTVTGDIVDAERKAQTVRRLAAEWAVASSQTIAMGDGANDLLMMSAAHLGVAFHAKPVVEQQADAAVRQGGLDRLLLLLA